MKKTFMLTLVLAAISTSAIANTTFYKWVDKNGSTHYTLTPPPKGVKSLGKMQTYNDYTAPVPQQVQSAPVAQPVAQPVAVDTNTTTVQPVPNNVDTPAQINSEQVAPLPR